MIIGIIAVVITVIIFGINTDNPINDKKINDNQEIITNDPSNIKEVKDSIIDKKQKSGPFQINKSQYKLGEKIFLVVKELQNEDKGEIVFLRPLNSTHYGMYESIPFDGKLKSNFNQFIQPKLVKSMETCKKSDIIGEWVIWFRGTNYEELRFKMLDEKIIGETGFDKPIC